ncbi:unnamed protein product [Lepidochelys kempii]
MNLRPRPPDTFRPVSVGLSAAGQTQIAPPPRPHHTLRKENGPGQAAEEPGALWDFGQPGKFHAPPTTKPGALWDFGQPGICRSPPIKVPRCIMGLQPT